MSQGDLIVEYDVEETIVLVEAVPQVDVVIKKSPDVIVLAAGGLGQEGDKGDQGPKGSKGDKGDPGVAGPVGPPVDAILADVINNRNAWLGVGKTLRIDGPSDGSILLGSGWVNTEGVNSVGEGVWSARQVAGEVALGIWVVDDAGDRFEVLADGTHKWGDGTNPTDINLYRSGPGVLRTDGELYVGSDFAANIGKSGQVFIPPYATPTIEFAPARDTNLYRAAAGILKTDGKLNAVGGLQVNGVDVKVLKLGADLAIAANAITVTDLQHRITGGGTLQTINGFADVKQVTLKAHGTPFTINSAANIYATPAGGSLTIAANQAVELMYDPTSSVWIVIGVAAAAGGGVDYIGNWGSGITYKQGDVVRYNGVDYIAVNPSTGQQPPAATSIVGASVVTVLPAAPFDGQKVILVDSITVPTYSWQLQWVASASCWIFVGGSRLSQTVPANFSSASAAYVDLTGGPSFTVPRAGVYEIGFGASVYEPSGNVYVDMIVKVGAAAVVTSDYVRHRGQTGDFISIGRSGLRKTCAAADVIKLQGKTDGVNAGQWENRWLTVIPVTLT
jgi:hypothetical protein